MAQYDGSIRINTKIDSKEASAQLMTLENRIVKTADKVASLRSKMDALKNTKIPTYEYSEMQKELAKAEKNADSLYGKLRVMEQTGDKTSAGYIRLKQQIKDADQLVSELRNGMLKLEESGKAFTLGSDTDQYANLGQQLQYAENDLSALNLRHDELIAKQGNVSDGYKKIGDVSKSVFSKIGSIISGAGNSVKKFGSFVKNAFSNLNRSAKNSSKALSSMGLGLKNLIKYGLGIRSLYSLFNKLSSAIKEGYTNLYNNNERFKNSIDSLKASAATLKNSLAAAFRPLVDIAIPYIKKVMDYMSALLNSVGQFFAAITGQKTYTKAIKQTAGAMQDAAKATKKAKKEAEGYLSPLDEINKFTKENKEDNDDDLGGIGAGGTMFEELPISDKFKDLAQWIKDMWEDADFTELGAFLGQKLKDALDSIPWDGIKKTAQKIGKSIATLINGFIEVEGLGYSIGKTLVEAINTGFEFLNSFVHNLHWDSIGHFIADTLNGFFENIDWELIRDTFVTGFKGLSDSINAFIRDFNWDNISNTISNAINIAFETIYTFFSTVDWAKLGKELGNQLMETIKKIDWKEVGRAIGSIIQAVLDFLINFVSELDFKEVAKAIADVLKGVFETVDMGDVAKVILTLLAAELAKKATVSLFKSAASKLLAGFGGALKSLGGIGGLLKVDLSTILGAGTFAEIGLTIGTAVVGGITAAIGGFHIGQWLYEWITGEQIEMSFTEQVKEIFSSFTDGSWVEAFKMWGSDIVEGLKLGITDAFSAIGNWIDEHIFQPFVNGFKDLFGIHSPSNVMQELGVFIIEGLLNGINSMVESVKETWNFMKQTAVDTWNSVGETIMNTWQNINQSSTETWGSISNFLKEKYNQIKENAMQNFSKIRDFIKECWTNIYHNTSEKTQSIKSKISDAMNNIRELWSGAWSSMKDKFVSIIDSVKDAIQSAFDWIAEKVNAMAEKLSSIGSKAKGLFNFGGFTSGKTSFSFNTKSYSTYSSAMASLPNADFPGYATGQVIPTSMKKHLAWLGDNPRETEVVSPLSTIEEAVINAIDKIGVSGRNTGVTPVNLTIQVALDSNILGQTMIDWGKLQQMASGNNPYGLGNT